MWELSSSGYVAVWATENTREAIFDATSRTPAEPGYTRDAIGANLDRVQIVKGWLDKFGNTHEKVCDVAWSDDRVPGADGKLLPVGNTVDVANASWTNMIGSSELLTGWEDPDFDPAEGAFYYTRDIEIPTPPWTACDVKYY